MVFILRWVWQILSLFWLNIRILLGIVFSAVFLGLTLRTVLLEFLPGQVLDLFLHQSMNVYFFLLILNLDMHQFSFEFKVFNFLCHLNFLDFLLDDLLFHLMSFLCHFFYGLNFYFLNLMGQVTEKLELVSLLFLHLK